MNPWVIKITTKVPLLILENQSPKRLFFFKILFICFQRVREGEREGEKYQCAVASHTPPTGDLACNPGMCPDWESNQRPFGSQPTLNPLSHTSQGSLQILDGNSRSIFPCIVTLLVNHTLNLICTYIIKITVIAIRRSFFQSFFQRFYCLVVKGNVKSKLFKVGNLIIRACRSDNFAALSGEKMETIYKSQAQTNPTLRA